MTAIVWFSGWLFGAGGRRSFPRSVSAVREGGETEPTQLLSSADLALVDAIRRGDEVAFEQVYRTYVRGLVVSAEGYLRSLPAAEDAVADVFANLWRTRAAWRPTRSVKAYLFGAVRNAALGQLRRAQVEARAEVVGAHDEPLGMGTPPAGAEMTTDIATRMVAVEHALAELPEARRQIMYLRWQQGMSADEIATVLGTTRNAVDLQLSRAMKALRMLLPEWVKE